MSSSNSSTRIRCVHLNNVAEQCDERGAAEQRATFKWCINRGGPVIAKRYATRAVFLTVTTAPNASRRTKAPIWVYVLCAFVVLAGCVAAFVSSNNYEVGELSESDAERLAVFQSLASEHQVNIADEHEDGERLVLCLTFVNSMDLSPLADEAIQFYHTSSEGEYEPEDPNDESSARLRGRGITDLNGRLIVRTILPGDYGSSADNRHIHMTVRSAMPTSYDIHFKQFSTYMLRRFVARSDQHFLADLKRGDHGELVSFLSIECRIAH